MCLSLSEGHTCAYGSCVNNSCVCNPGFQQNVEFYYGEVPTDTIIFCNYHPKAMLTFSCCLLIFTIAVTAAHVITARSRRHFKRLIPMLLGYSLYTVSLIIRIARVHDSLFGYDQVYSVTLILAYLALSFQETVHTNKYAIYLIMSYGFKKSSRRTMLLFAKFREALSLVVFAAWTTMGSTAFVESQQTSGEIAFASIAMVTIFNFGLCITEYILFSMIIRDLRKVVARTAATKWKKSFSKAAERKIGHLTVVGRVLGILHFYAGLSALLALIYPWWLSSLMYIFHTSFLCYQLTGMLIIRKKIMSLCQRGRRKTEEEKPSFGEETLKSREDPAI